MSGTSICNVCQDKLYWDDNVRSKKTGNKIPLDENGNFHKHRDRSAERLDLEQDENQTPIVRPETLPPMGTAPPPQIQKFFPKEQDQRTKDIAAAHDENMQASENLVNAINSLTGEAATLTAALGDFKDFLATSLHELTKDHVTSAKISTGGGYHEDNNEDPGS